jgi:hypothetical protein
MWKAHQLFPVKHAHFEFLLRLQEQMIKFTTNSFGMLIRSRWKGQNGEPMSAEEELICPLTVSYTMDEYLCIAFDCF